MFAKIDSIYTIHNFVLKESKNVVLKSKFFVETKKEGEITDTRPFFPVFFFVKIFFERRIILEGIGQKENEDGWMIVWRTKEKSG